MHLLTPTVNVFRIRFFSYIHTKRNIFFSLKPRADIARYSYFYIYKNLYFYIYLYTYIRKIFKIDVFQAPFPLRDFSLWFIITYFL